MLVHLQEQGSEGGEQGCEDQEEDVGYQAGCRALIAGLLDLGAPRLAARPGLLKLQFWDDLMDPVIVGGNPDVDAWAVPAGTTFTPADHPSL